MKSLNAAAYARVSLSSSPLDSFFGFALIPPFPPPYGRFTTAFFHVIQAARAISDGSSSSGWYLIPPLVGPRASLWWTLTPLNVFTVPSSIFIGNDTSRMALGLLMTSYTAGSRFISSQVFFTLTSCDSHAFSSLLILTLLEL